MIWLFSFAEHGINIKHLTKSWQIWQNEVQEEKTRIHYSVQFALFFEKRRKNTFATLRKIHENRLNAPLPPTNKKSVWKFESFQWRDFWGSSELRQSGGLRRDPSFPAVQAITFWLPHPAWGSNLTTSLEIARFYPSGCTRRIRWSCEGLTSVHNEYTGWSL